ncbi:MAG: hypothetical protein V1736_05180 [Pseudomonadota bacterium]
MAEIKSALEKAMERAEKFGRATGEEIKAGMYLDEGRRLAARYLREEELNLIELLESQPSASRAQVKKGMKETLLRNIILPRDDESEENSNRAMNGLQKLKKNNTRAKKALGYIEEVFRHYRRAMEDAGRQLSSQLETKMENLEQQLGQQLRMKAEIDVEDQPQLQEQMLQVSTEIGEHFNRLLEEQKDILRST